MNNGNRLITLACFGFKQGNVAAFPYLLYADACWEYKYSSRLPVT
jgi:hypothetical protein